MKSPVWEKETKERNQHISEEESRQRPEAREVFAYRHVDGSLEGGSVEGVLENRARRHSGGRDGLGWVVVWEGKGDGGDGCWEAKRGEVEGGKY